MVGGKKGKKAVRPWKEGACRNSRKSGYDMVWPGLPRRAFSPDTPSNRGASFTGNGWNSAKFAIAKIVEQALMPSAAESTATAANPARLRILRAANVVSGTRALSQRT